jgi:hypothetical protein
MLDAPLTLVALLMGAGSTLGVLGLWLAVRRWRRGDAEKFSSVLAALSDRIARLEREREGSPVGRKRFARGMHVRVEVPAPVSTPVPTLIAVPDLSAESKPVPSEFEPARRFEEICALADAGNTADAIARATGQPIGQVELVLGLRRQFSRATPEQPAQARREGRPS